MSDEMFKTLNADLGSEFDRFALENPEWIAANVPKDAIIVIQTDDPKFNAWAKSVVEPSRSREKPVRPVVLVHLRKMLPPRSRIVQAEVELIPPTQALGPNSVITNV